VRVAAHRSPAQDPPRTSRPRPRPLRMPTGVRACVCVHALHVRVKERAVVGRATLSIASPGTTWWIVMLSIASPGPTWWIVMLSIASPGTMWWIVMLSIASPGMTWRALLRISGKRELESGAWPMDKPQVHSLPWHPSAAYSRLRAERARPLAAQLPVALVVGGTW